MTFLETLIPILMLIVIPTLLIGIIFLPIWCIIDIATTNSHSKMAKTFWILGVIFLFPITGIIYGLLFTKSGFLRFLVILIISLSFIGGTSYWSSQFFIEQPPEPIIIPNQLKV